MCCQQDSASFVKDYLPLIISVLAIIISVLTIAFDRRGKRAELENEYFSQIFKDSLFQTLPRNRNGLSFKKQKLTNVEPLLSTLSQMRKNADYFKYSNPKFHKRFTKINQEFEDYLAVHMNRDSFDAKAKKAFFRECDKRLKKLYRTITKQYFGV